MLTSDFGIVAGSIGDVAGRAAPSREAKSVHGPRDTPVTGRIAIRPFHKAAASSPA